MKKSYRIIGIFSFIFFLGMFSFLVYHIIVNILFNENFVTKRGTIDYYLVINSKVLRTFPIIECSDEDVNFYSSCSDGNAPAWSGLGYSSTETISVLVDSIKKYMERESYYFLSESSTQNELHFKRTKKKECFITINLMTEKNEEKIKIFVNQNE